MNQEVQKKTIEENIKIKKKIIEEDKIVIKNHINSYPRIESNYLRR